MGTLFFDFSQDGTNWSTYPVNGFAILSGVNKVHTAWKGGRYMRPRFVGSGGRTYFRLKTYYSNTSLPLSAPLNQTIGDDQDSTVVKSIQVGKKPDGTYNNEPSDGSAFQTTTPLSSGGTYTSSLIDVSDYSQIETHIYSDQPGTLTGKWYDDESKTTLIRTFSRPYENGEVGTVSYFSSPTFSNYVEYEYTNGNTNQTSFYLDFKLRTKSISGQILGVNDFIPDTVVANLNRSIIAGQDDAGNFRNTSVNSFGDLRVSIDSPLSSFGEVKTANLQPIVQIIFPYEINYDLVSSGGTGSGSLTYDSGTTLVSINSGAASSSSSILNSKRLIKYRTGQGLSIRFTSLFDNPVSGNTQFAGWGDDDDGFFFGYSGTTFGILRRTGGIDDFTPQSSWNVDVKDGSGSLSNPSSVDLNPQNGNVYEIQPQWHGYGAVKFNIESPVTGRFEVVHTIQYANNYLTPSTINPTYPIAYRCTNTTNTTNVELKTASMAAFNEGIVNYTGEKYSFSNAKATTTDTAIFNLTNKSTFKGRSNKTTIILDTLSVITDDNNDAGVTFTIVKNGTLASTSYSDVATYSVIESDVTGTYTSGTGSELFKVSTPTIITLKYIPKFIFSPGTHIKEKTLIIRISIIKSCSCIPRTV